MSWFRAHGEDAVPSPALLVHLGRVEENLRRMLEIAGSPGRIWPHVKTHKLPELVELQTRLGIGTFKCATVAEAEMLAGVEGVRRILLAFQPVGPNAERLVRLSRSFPKVAFATLTDCLEAAEALSRVVVGTDGGPRIDLFLDLDVGQGRTGIPAGAAALELAVRLESLDGLRLAGLHAYDGHLGITDPVQRTMACDEAYAPVAALRRELEGVLGRPLEVVAGGSPTFQIHARRPDVTLSPGTTVLWDAGYARKLPDLPFLPAAVLLTRIVSKPAPNRICLDLGHKAVGSEMPAPRMEFLDLPEAQFVSHSEEHLVVESPAAAGLRVGGSLHALPWHVCPTVALHSEVWPVRAGEVLDPWTVAARARRLRF